MTVQTNVTATHKNVYMALAAAQMEMDPVRKGAINPAFKGEGKPKGTAYADLADVVDAVRGPLNRHGMAFFHQIIEGNIMRTSLVHGESESRIDCDVPLLVDRQNMQGMKSATTYAKRIGLESVTGVAPEDDDGNAATAAAAPAEPRKQIAKPVEKIEGPKADPADELRDKMIRNLRAKGASLAEVAGFKADLAELQKLSPEYAAQVEAEIATQEAAA